MLLVAQPLSVRGLKPHPSGVDLAAACLEAGGSHNCAAFISFL